MSRGQEVLLFLALSMNLIWGVASVALQTRVLRELRDTKKSTVDGEPVPLYIAGKPVTTTGSPQRIQRSPLIEAEARRDYYNR